MNENLKVQHLLRRAGFGFSLRKKFDGDANKVLESLFEESKKFEIVSIHHADVIQARSLFSMSPEERKILLADLAANVKLLNLEWLKTMGRSEGQMREKAALFWHGHFAVRTRGYEHLTLYLNTIRKNALGNFADLLKAISKEPAMLKFLNNQQNRKNSPNENFARELLELFTLGRGHYTEKDIKEAARAFTGWGFDNKNDFVFRRHIHDTGTKEFMGKKGNFTGDDILEIILSNPRTAYFITEKIYRFYVNDKINESHVEELARSFFESGYAIKPLLEKIFSSDWFYDEENIGSLIKSPVELIVGLNRTFGISYADPQPLLAIQRLLGQMLFFPPNVSGWAGGRNWIDNSSLALRINLGSLLSQSAEINLRLKADENDEMDFSDENRFIKKHLQCNFNWNQFETHFGAHRNTNQQWERLCNELLPISKAEKYPSQPELDNFKSMAIYLTKLPEYQIN